RLSRGSAPGARGTRTPAATRASGSDMPAGTEPLDAISRATAAPPDSDTSPAPSDVAAGASRTVRSTAGRDPPSGVVSRTVRSTAGRDPPPDVAAGAPL